jgi:hypothetical protein
MRANTIIPLYEQKLMEGRKILRESCEGLTLEQQIVVEGVYNEFLPLIEATLKQELKGQNAVLDLFKKIEDNVTSGGGNRTAIGKGKDVAVKVKEIMGKAAKWLQDTAPVKAFDQKFEDLKAKVAEKLGGDDSKIVQYTKKLGELAKEHPGKTACIIGVLTALASLAGGPMGGAIAGQVLRGTVELLKGEKLSTAIGKGLKTAAIGWLTGMAVKEVKDYMIGLGNKVGDMFEIGTSEIKKIAKLQLGTHTTNVGTIKVYSSYSKIPYIDGTFYGKTEDLEQLMKLRSIFTDSVHKFASDNQSMVRYKALGSIAKYAGDNVISPSDIAENQQRMTSAYFKFTKKLAEMNDPKYLDEINKGLAQDAKNAAARKIAELADEVNKQNYNKTLNSIKKMGDAIQAAAQGAATGAASYDGKSEDKKEKTKESINPFNEMQMMELFEAIEQQQILTEGPIWDKVKSTAKGAASKVADAGKKIAGAAAQKVATKGKNLTTKITADKLMQKWKKASKQAGKPILNNASLHKFLTDNGVKPEFIEPAFQQMKLKQPKIITLKQQVDELDINDPKAFAEFYKKLSKTQRTQLMKIGKQILEPT